MKKVNKNSKVRNIIIGLGMCIALGYFILPNPNQFKTLKKQVSPTVSLYSEPKSLHGKFSFIDDERNKTSLATVAKGKWLILYFGYTSCPDVCPVDLAVLNQMLTKMAFADKLQVVFISVDAKRDVGKLADFVGRFNRKFIGLSATPAELAKITRALGIYHEVAKIENKANQDHSEIDHSKADNYLINHTASYLLLNPDLQLTGLLTNPHHADKIAPALDLIITTLN